MLRKPQLKKKEELPIISRQAALLLLFYLIALLILKVETIKGNFYKPPRHLLRKNQTYPFSSLTQD
jgi:hypothetical protein